MTPALFTDVLEAGDRLETAIQTGDFDAAALALDDRKRALGALSAAGLGRPSEAIAARARAQVDRLALAFSGRLSDIGGSLANAARAGRAQGTYRQPSVGRAALDTAPR